MDTDYSKVFGKYASPETIAKIKDYDSVSEMWNHCVGEYAGKTAICDAGASYTFAQLEEDAADYRALLPEGQRIGILVPNSYEFVKVYIAAVTLGKTVLIMPVQLPAEAVAGCCLKYGLCALVYSDATEERTAVAKKIAPGVALLNSSQKSGKKLPLCDVPADADCVMMFTGGTTGKSKAALLTNAAVMQGTVNGCLGIPDVFGQRYVLSLPLSHVFGLIRNLMTSLYTGSTMYICRDTKDLFRDIAVFRPTILVTVPALAELALNLSKKFGKNMLGPDLKTIICGAAAVPPYLIGEYRKFGISLLAGYGLTESANLVAGNPESEHKPSSVGLLYPNQEYRVVDGELWLRGRNMLKAYVGEDFPAYNAEGWFQTGDLVRFDEDGFMYITGRIKEIIVLPNGENVSPAEVEAHFSAHSAVQDCELYEDRTETGAAVLVLEILPRMTELSAVPEPERAKYLTDEMARINAELLPHERYNRLVIRRSDFERTPSMKIKRHSRPQA